MMPGMDGVEVYRHVEREQPGLARHFVFMTAGAVSALLREQMDKLDCLRME